MHIGLWGEFWLQLAVGMSVAGILGAWGGITAAMRLVRTRLDEMQQTMTDAMNDLEDTLRQKIHRVANDGAQTALIVSRLQEREQATKERLERIDRNIDSINTKQDRQTELLLQLIRQEGGRHG